ncbi:hypothetical protein P8605_27675 [Streptomyces sp. T-3]|nr:hypothetical protein [Streptomyces sp. T-3]
MAANRKFLATAVASAAALVAVTGCFGGEDKDPFEGMSADKIAKKANTAMKDAETFKMSMTGKDEKGKPTSGSYEIAGSGNCQGTLSGDGLGNVDFLQLGKDSYTKGDAAYWKAIMGSDELGKKAAGKWVQAPEGQSQQMCDTKDMFKADDAKGAKRGDDSEVDGKKAATLVKKEKGETTTFYIAAEGEPYYLKVVTKEAKKGETTTTITDFGKKFDVTAPPKGDVLQAKDLVPGA